MWLQKMLGHTLPCECHLFDNSRVMVAIVDYLLSSFVNNNDHQEEMLLSIRRETDLNRKVLLRDLEEKVKNELVDVQSVLNSYEQYFSIFEPAFESIKMTLEEIEATTTNEANLWKIRKDLYELESELWDMRWMLVESLLDFESTLGEILSDGN